MLRARDAFVDRGEGASLVQIGRVDGVAGPSQRVGEREESTGLSQRVMEQKQLSHMAPSMIESVGAMMALREALAGVFVTAIITDRSTTRGVPKSDYGLPFLCVTLG